MMPTDVTMLSMLWLEEKYINLLSPRLKLFHRVRPNQWAFRCPICMDSKKNEHKTRGGIYLHPRGTSYNMGCFNCGASMSFPNFLKLQDTYLYNEFVMERYKAKQDSSYTPPVPKAHAPEPDLKRVALSGLEPIDSLGFEHPAVRYLERRKMPQKLWHRLYFVLRFKQWEAQSRNTKHFGQDHPRLVIPFFDKQGNITRLTARAFGDEQPKYIYIKVKQDASRVFGLDTVDPQRTVYVFEGPLDSLFFENAIAVGSAALLVPELESFKDVVLVPDNQPRNSEVCKSIAKMVNSGHKVCLWDKDWGKDVNDMIMNGHSVDNILDLIKRSTVQGIAAQLKFSNWVKVPCSQLK
jgi:hypothetical protein